MRTRDPMAILWRFGLMSGLTSAEEEPAGEKGGMNRDVWLGGWSVWVRVWAWVCVDWGCGRWWLSWG